MEATDIVVRVGEVSEVGTARRSAVGLAERLGFGESQVGRIALTATELATNLVKHGGGGELILTGARDGLQELEILALDHGPGIVNLPEALRDGFSTAGSQGTGLGAVARQADDCDIYSIPGRGTAVLARFRREASRQRHSLVAGGVSLPHPAETVSGDAWAMAVHAGRPRVMVVDGLGHGPYAAEAAAEAVRVFRQSNGSLSDLMADAHAALRPTRGAAIGIAELDAARGVLSFAGLGNISGTVIRGAESKSLVSHAGIIGHQYHRIQEFTHPWSRGSVLILHSDGLQSRWRPENYPGLLNHHPTLVAAMLYRDHVRGKDDVTVVVMREVE